MAHHRSAFKRIRTSAKAAAANKHYRSMMRTAIKKVRAAADKATAEQAYRQACSILDKLALRGIIHKNKAANAKSRLARRVNALA
ncbi:MAG: 30S ribosomal protein S20 [Calditrichaeota bacterium]|nr:30S ribosomal protein S20 [Calditrichota bacterium]